jgi:hypothetical protein
MADVAAGQSGMARLIAMLEAGMPLDAERAASCRIFYHFAAEGMNDPNLASELASYYDWWRREVGDVIETLQADGHFAAQEPSALAETLVGLAEGLAIQGVFAADAAQASRLSKRLAVAVARFDSPHASREMVA